MPNRLAAETSPYLLQHADNPVDWYPWGEEALQRARDSGRPILLSDRQSTSGQPLMETAVLQVRDAASGAALYTHEHYHLPRLAVVPHNDQTAMVLHEGVQIAHAGSDVEANRFVAALLDGIGPSPVPRRPHAHHTIEREVANG